MPSVMSNKKFLAAVHEFTAIQAVGPSAVRGQPKGTLETIRAYLGRLHLDRLAGMDRIDYARWLDVHTRHLQQKLQPLQKKSRGQEKQWGVARKAINLFIRSCLYNKYLSTEFRLTRVQRHMEIPLDSAVARGLRKRARAERRRLPPWQGLIELESEASRQFQDFAEEYARDEELPGRVLLDTYLWPENR